MMNKHAFQLVLVFQLLVISATRGTNQNTGFEVNNGQFDNTNSTIDRENFYRLELGDLLVYITNKGLTYTMLKSEERKEDKEGGRKLPAGMDEWEHTIKNIDMQLEGASILKENITHSNDLSSSLGYRNYYKKRFKNGYIKGEFIGNVLINNVYPGIDWRLYIANNKLKYDFIVHPGANPNAIQIILKGNANFQISAEGDMQMLTEFGDLIDTKPLTYQTDMENVIPSAYVKKESKSYGNHNSFSYGFQLSDYDQSKTVIIDPTLEWGTYFNGNLADGPTSITHDSLGNTYLTGYTASQDLPLLNGGGYYDTTVLGGSACFLTKFNEDGVLLWSTFYGGSVSDAAAQFKEKNGKIILVGTALSNDFPLLDGGGYFDSTLNSSFAFDGDVYIMEFTDQGFLTWSTFFGGMKADWGSSVDFLNDGSILIGGSTTSIDLDVLDNGGYYDDTHNGDFDGFLAHFSPTKQLLWCTYFGGDSLDMGPKTTTNDSNICVLLNTWSANNLPLVNNGGYFDSTRSGDHDVFIAKLSLNSKNIVWGTYYGGSADDLGLAKADTNNTNYNSAGGYGFLLDKDDNLYTFLGTQSPDVDLIDNGGYFDSTLAGGSDMLALRFDASCNLNWGTYIGGSDAEFMAGAESISLDVTGNVYVALSTNSPDYVTVNPGNGSFFMPSLNNSLADNVFMKFDPNCKVKWSTYSGSAGFDFTRSTNFCENTGSFYATGEWNGPNSNTIEDAGNGSYFSGSFNNSHDGFISKFSFGLGSYISATSLCDCNNTAQAIAYGGQAPYTYFWSTGDTLQTADSLCPGTYSVIVNDIYFNSDTQLVTISGPGPPTASIVGPDSICLGDTFTLNASGGGSYYWNTLDSSSQLMLAPNTTSTYYVVVDTCGTDTAHHTINVVTPPKTTTIGDTICNGDFAQIQATGGNAYLWSTGDSMANTNVSPSNTTTYYITVSNTLGCETIDSTTVLVHEPLIIELGNDTTICNEEEIILNANGAASYLWNNGSTASSVLVDTSGTILLQYIDSNNCSGVDSITITHNYINVDLGNDFSICKADTFSLHAISNNAANYLWNTGQTIEQITGNENGTYSITVTDGVHCSKTDEITVTLKPSTDAFIDEEPLPCGTKQLYGTEDENINYLWSTGENTSTIEVANSGEYWLEIFNGHCTTYDTIDVEVINSEMDETLIPNVFTPNGDGMNDELIFKLPPTDVFMLTIFNRWGRIIFESNDVNFNWDGGDSPEGVYQYIINYKEQCGEQQTLKEAGYVTLLR